MKKIAFYGKGGIGKSTIVANIAALLAGEGYTVMQIGCDPKADSTILLRHKQPLPTVMEKVRTGVSFTIDDVTMCGYNDVILAEAGGPLPGLGCAGRGVITALETLEAKGAYDKYQPDFVLYDVLGDVVCGGFAMPMRRGYADEVYIITSGENMAIYAAANIAMAIENMKTRGYAPLAGLIHNRRNVKDEDRKVQALADDFKTRVIGAVTHDALITRAEEEGKVLAEAYPDATALADLKAIAQVIRDA